MNSYPVFLYLGPKWWGSDATALAHALRERGCSLIEVDYEDFLPMHWDGFVLKVVRKLTRRFQADSYNRAVAAHAANPALDGIIVFKGMLLRPETLALFNCPKYCFYPDVSFLDHGPEIQGCLPMYDCVFTTKRYHLDQAESHPRVQDFVHVSHGADARVHRRIGLSDPVKQQYDCDISFVGCWSPKKERLLKVILSGVPDAQLRLWGMGWNRAAPEVQACWTGRGAYGDELALIYQCSRINLGLLSEAGGGTAQGDDTTVRSWQIPASGGFMIHERTNELLEVFTDGESVACFDPDSPTDLAEVCTTYLGDDETRQSIAGAGYEVVRDKGKSSYGAAADAILEKHGS